MQWVQASSDPIFLKDVKKTHEAFSSADTETAKLLQ